MTYEKASMNIKTIDDEEMGSLPTAHLTAHRTKKKTWSLGSRRPAHAPEQQQSEGVSIREGATRIPRSTSTRRHLELEQLKELTLPFLDTWCEPGQVDGIAAVQQREQLVAVAVPTNEAKFGVTYKRGNISRRQWTITWRQ